jgi:hypothetical protein
MWGLVLTLFAVVLFFWTPASTWAAVYEGAADAPAVLIVAAWADWVASGAASAIAAAAATARRVRGDDMSAGPPSIVRKLS